MSLERAWKIFKKRRMYDDVHGQYALERLVKEIESHMGGALCPDVEVHYLNGSWYGLWEGKMHPLTWVLDQIKEMKKPPGTAIRIRVGRPEEE